MILKLYQLLTSVAAPFIELYLHKRKKNGKEDAQRFEERFGNAAFPRPEGSLIWVHAASVGESLSILPMIQKLLDKLENTHLLLTTGTTTSAKMIESRLPDRAFHQYVPIDTTPSVNRFLKHWKPDLAIWVESELWPNLVVQTAKQCPLMLANGRMSDSSYRNWRKYRSLSQQVLSRFSLVLPQSKHDGERFENLGARNVKYLGNIKFDAPPLPSDSQKMGEIVNMIGQRPVWLAASTHEGEEKIVASVHKEIKENHPELLTIIAPRHPKRLDDIMETIKESDLNIAVRSRNDEITEDTDIYIADTIGEMGILYRLVPIVFIGGTLVEHGGQNPLEAARLNCVIIYGPYMDNFIEIRRELEERNAAISITNETSLKNAVEEVIFDHEKQEDLMQKSSDLVKEKSGVVDAYITEITPYLDRIAVKNNEAS